MRCPQGADPTGSHVAHCMAQLMSDGRAPVDSTDVECRGAALPVIARSAPNPAAVVPLHRTQKYAWVAGSAHVAGR